MRMVLGIFRTVLVICQILDFLTRRSPWRDLKQTRFCQSLGLAWAPEILVFPVPPDTLSLPAPLCSLSFAALSLSLFILFISFILGL
jgi:hypothetical protein